MKYAFDHFVLDVDARELVGADGPVHLEPKVFDLIAHLVENRERVVTKDELISEIWDGRFISDAAISSAISAARRALGDDGRSQRHVRTFHGRGFRFSEAVTEIAPQAETVPDSVPEQTVRFCSSMDGTRIAYAVAGSGPPLLKASNWLHHLEFDWESPVWRHVFAELARYNTLVRYDQRGNGLSSWEVSDHSLDRQIEDIETVVAAAKLDRFNLLGLSQGTLNGVAYAARHPDRVKKLVLIGGYVRGWALRADPEGIAVREASMKMMKSWWGKSNPIVRQIFSNLLMPDAPAESHRWFNDLQKETASPENAVELMMADREWDIRDLLPRIKAETLVIHARNDAAVPYEEGQDIAAAVPNAHFVTLDSRNHIMPATDPAWTRCAQLIEDFLSG